MMDTVKLKELYRAQARERRGISPNHNPDQLHEWGYEEPF